MFKPQECILRKADLAVWDGIKHRSDFWRGGHVNNDGVRSEECIINQDRKYIINEHDVTLDRENHFYKSFINYLWHLFTIKTIYL